MWFYEWAYTEGGDYDQYIKEIENMTRSESNQVNDMNNNAENQIEIQRRTFFNVDII